MTNEERDRRLSAIEFDSIDLGNAYGHLGDSFTAFISRVRSFRPDAVEAFFERWSAQRARADAEAERIEKGIFEANVGITNDGPDRWTRELDRIGYLEKMNRNGTKKGK